MITRSKLVEQLRVRDHQIRSRYKCTALSFFSPKPHITSRADVAVATFWTFVFNVLVLSSFVTLYLRHFGLSILIICIGIFLLVRLRTCRQALVKKKERLPLSM